MPVVAEDDALTIERLVLGPFSTNCYLLTSRRTGDSAVIDTPDEPETILKRLEGTNPRYILLTHNHMDHLGALAALHSRLGVPLGAHPEDSVNLPVEPEMDLDDGDTLAVGDLTVHVLHTPGHTQGGVCFLTGNYLLSGDTLFRGGPGKTWRPDALRQILESLERKVFVLPDETVVFPGHGESTLIGTEKKEYAVFAAKQHPENLCGDIVWLTS
jgi:glyoxylase-like metal-dependent hydrolase (beta-lactamase superfamily II)